MTKKPAKRNPTDLTLRNLRALKKRIEKLESQKKEARKHGVAWCKSVEKRIEKLECEIVDLRVLIRGQIFFYTEKAKKR